MSDSFRHKTRKHRDHISQAGFTLLEMLVAITLFALITALLTGSLRFGARVWETGERLNTETKVASVQQLLFRWIQEAEQMRMPGADNKILRGAFDGDAAHLRFLGTQHGIGMPGGYYLNDLYIEDNGNDGRALMLRRRLVQPGIRGLTEVPPPEAGEKARVLLDGAVSVQIAYFGREDAGAAPAWIDTWSDRLDLPQLVRVRVRFAKGDRRHWPDLIVPLAFADR